MRTKNKIPNTQKTITRSIGKYFRAMETELFVFFVNFEESDENGQVIMYRKEQDHLELVSGNYFAFVGIMEEFQEGNETWMSPRMKKERALYIQEEIIPLVKEYIALSHKGDTSCLTEDGQNFNRLEEEIEEFYVRLPETDVCLFLEEKFAEYL
jgi:hypothetical protein